jgi:N-succinyldiaminopimelate aminotransferase
MNPELGRLAPYPFERLARLRAGLVPPAGLSAITMTIGEPQHAPPALALEALVAALDGVGVYPATAGLPELRIACAGWLERRFRLSAGSVDPEKMILPVNGTREALFSFVQAAVDRGRAPLVAMPNPFYQIYEGAAFLAGAEPCYVPTSAASGWLPDLDAIPDSAWARCQLLFICTPGNPTGAVMSLEDLGRVLALADRHGFIVASDECYSELYDDETAPPPGLLEASARLGRPGFERCVVFHSLSKRSNLPGLRSGFVAGDAALLDGFRLYRTYHGCALPVHVQRASLAAWNDETHVIENRRRYRAKFDAVLPLLAPALEVERPAASFYLWPQVPGGDDEAFAAGLYARQNVAVLPGRYLGRDAGQGNPGAGRLRISLVPDLARCTEAARRIRDYIEEG